MKHLTLVLMACLAAATINTPVLAEPEKESSEQKDTPVAPPALPPEVAARIADRIRDEVAPLTPEEIKLAREMINQSQRAANNRYERAEPRITTEPLDSRPGNKIPTIYAGVGFNTNVMFTDAGGKPWPIRVSSIGNRDAFNLRALDEHAFEIEVLIPNTYTNITVFLENQRSPLVFNVAPPDKHLDVIKTYAINGLSPASQDEHETAARMAQRRNIQPGADPGLNLFLDGVPPADALPIPVIQGPDVELWAWNHRLIIRTQMRLTTPSAEADPLYGANGWRVYSIRRPTSIMTFIANGQIQTVSVSESAIANLRGGHER